MADNLQNGRNDEASSKIVDHENVELYVICPFQRQLRSFGVRQVRAFVHEILVEQHRPQLGDAAFHRRVRRSLAEHVASLRVVRLRELHEQFGASLEIGELGQLRLG